MRLKDIVVNHKPSCAPYIEITPNLKEKMEKAGFSKVEISISHSDNTATAICLME
jgi:phosphopantetheinyl transferase (holo-ACP synthase)